MKRLQWISTLLLMMMVLLLLTTTVAAEIPTSTTETSSSYSNSNNEPPRFTTRGIGSPSRPVPQEVVAKTTGTTIAATTNTKTSKQRQIRRRTTTIRGDDRTRIRRRRAMAQPDKVPKTSGGPPANDGYGNSQPKISPSHKHHPSHKHSHKNKPSTSSPIVFDEDSIAAPSFSFDEDSITATASPSTLPSTGSPSARPTSSPATAVPSSGPSTGNPTNSPSSQPTASPSKSPLSLLPTSSPTRNPSIAPTSSPTQNPSIAPTLNPTQNPSIAPTSNPTPSPSIAPTASPTSSPTLSPSNDKRKEAPIVPTPPSSPILSPNTPVFWPPVYQRDSETTSSPTSSPTRFPTSSPTHAPTASPTGSPSSFPTASPSKDPTLGPSNSPTLHPTILQALGTLPPSTSPTASPSQSPTKTQQPTMTLSPTASPTVSPSSFPSSSPTVTAQPTPFPTRSPTQSPTENPTSSPSLNPTASPTSSPSPAPTNRPTASPSVSSIPTSSVAPTSSPTATPKYSWSYLHDTTWIAEDLPEKDNSNSNRLRVGHDTMGQRQISFVMFDIRFLSGTVNEAGIWLYVHQQSDGMQMSLYATDRSDDDWDDWDQVTWSNHPSIDYASGPIWSGPVRTRPQDDWMWLDLTSYLHRVVNNPDYSTIPAFFSFAMVPIVEAGTRHFAAFSSGKSWSRRPEYSITYTPQFETPFSSSRFRDVIRNCHLQSPKSAHVVFRSALRDYSAWFYYLTADDTMKISQYGGGGRRTEILHESFWDSDTADEKMMNITLRMPTPPPYSGVKQVTISQIHHFPEYGETDGPLVRLHYRDNDSLSVNIRTSQTPKIVRTFELLRPWPDNEWINVEIKVFRHNNDTLLTIKVNGEEKIRNNISYWTFHYNYFKAGAYMSATEDSTHINTVEFKQLDVVAPQ